MSTRTRKGPSAPKKDGTPPPGRAAGEAEAPSFEGPMCACTEFDPACATCMLLTYDAPSPSMQTVRAVVGGNNIGVAPGSLMDVFDPSGALAAVDALLATGGAR